VAGIGDDAPSTAATSCVYLLKGKVELAILVGSLSGNKDASIEVAKKAVASLKQPRGPMTLATARSGSMART
jgi:hypothetical protein